VVVYAGAILVTFLFVLMLANPSGRAPYDRHSWEALVSAVSGAVLVGILSMTFARALASPDAPHWTVKTEAERTGHVLADEHMAKLSTELFGRHLIAVEVAGTLLLAALVGAAIIVAQGKEPEGSTKEPRGS
jgi:NADH-quinone oxidoreductase subunit J